MPAPPKTGMTPGALFMERLLANRKPLLQRSFETVEQKQTPFGNSRTDSPTVCA